MPDPKNPKNKVTNSGRPAENSISASAPSGIDPVSKQHKDHWVLSEAERTKGLIRPVRTSYKHEVCGAVTSMPVKIAETYAKQPDFYGQTFCATCKDYTPVGEHGKFVWLDDGTKVGT